MYNEWLKSEEIQKLTETEPCSLAEEYEYQKSWEEDNQRTSKDAWNWLFFILRTCKTD